MRDPLERTKVVIRHLPPSLTESDFFQQIDGRFGARCNYVAFRPGKNSQKNQRHSRAYIDFKRPDDVFEFADFFDGHVFVNEKGAQYKAIVEYAPSQRVPRYSTKKDGRGGTIFKDPDYLEFLKLIAKPVEHLPSAEIQLERKEAEQAGTAKDTPIVTPLMEFIRHKRAAESGTQGSSVAGKISRRVRAASPRKLGASAAKRGSEKKKYIVKENAKGTSRKEKSIFTVVARREDQSMISSGIEISDMENGIPLTADSGKKRFLLLKGKERDLSNVSEDMSQQRSVISVRNSSTSTAAKENQKREAGGRLMRSILLNNEIRHSQPLTGSQPHNLDSEKRVPRPINLRSGFNDNVSNTEQHASSSHGDAKRDPNGKLAKKELHGLVNVREKQEKRTRNKDRPDRGVWAPRSRSDVSQSIDEHSSSSVSQSTHSLSDSVEVFRGGVGDDIPYGSRSGELVAPVIGHSSSFVENGSIRHLGRRGGGIMKDDSSLKANDGKSSKRGLATGHHGQEKQVWVQKSSSGS